MKLASLRSDSRDGELVVVRRDGSRFLRAADIAPSMQAALDQWSRVEPLLRQRALEAEAEEGETLSVEELCAPLPRAYEWLDGSAYINHIELVRKARGAVPPEDLASNPLVYQGGSGVLLGARDPIALTEEEWGIDFESELAVVLDDTPRGVSVEQALDHVRLITQVNDVSLRNLIPGELKKGFGFLVSKPSSAFGPFAVTPDELGDSWRDGRVYLTLRSYINGTQVGDTEAGPDMHFSFAELIAHICQTRSLTAGTIVGSGTVSNRDTQRGVSCLAERRMLEVLAEGEARSPFLTHGDLVEIEMSDAKGESVFGRIRQRVEIDGRGDSE